MTDILLDDLRAVLGARGLLTGDDIGPRYFTDPRGEGPAQPRAVLRPASTDEVSRVLSLCHGAGQPVAVQGGMTGLVVGAVPQHGELVISLERMSRIEAVSAENATMQVQAGVPLQQIQEAADAKDMVFPLDLGARGSATIGGNLSTNAGGNRVIRFGMTRDLTLGVEAVLADGTVVSSLNGFIKNNTGYDLKQLFIGSEGTLGLITRATLRLFPKPRTQLVAFCGAPDFAHVTELMRHVRATLGGDLSAFEVIWAKTYGAIVDHMRDVTPPLPRDHGFYVLIEMMGSTPETDHTTFETALGAALEAGMITDAVLSRSDAEVGALWDVRDNMAHAMSALQPCVGFDVSLKLADMAELEPTLEHRLSTALGPSAVYTGGHLADGNLHLVAKTLGSGPLPRAEIQRIVYGLMGEIGGSISAEHGIGTLKRAHLPQSRDSTEIALMRTLKAALDPKGVLNPGRIFALHTNQPEDAPHGL